MPFRSTVSTQGPAVAERIAWWRTDLGEDEIAGVSAAIRSRRINQGPLCSELERRLAESAGVPHAVVTTSGSVAMLLALMAHGIGPGDEVIVPALTFIAPAHAALLLGATVRLVDVGGERPLCDPTAVAAAVGPATRAIVAVHLNGRICDVKALGRIAREAGATLIEDCAQAFASRGAAAELGQSSGAAAFSLGITKLVTTGEGGMVAVSDRGLADKLARLRNHGVVSIADNVFDGPGCNFRMTDLQAAVGLSQVAKVASKIAGVRRVYDHYVDALDRPELRGCMRVLPVATTSGEVPLWSELLCSDRDAVVAHLDSRGIEAKPFHPSLGASPHLRSGRSFRNAEWYAAHGLTLPSGPDQPSDALERTVTALYEVANRIDDELGAAPASE